MFTTTATITTGPDGRATYHVRATDEVPGSTVQVVAAHCEQEDASSPVVGDA